MKTIYISRNLAFAYGFNKVLDETKKHQEKSRILFINDTFSGLYIEPNLYKTITQISGYEVFFTDKKEDETICDIYISNNLNDMNGETDLRILYFDGSFSLDEIANMKNIYIIQDWSSLIDILNFYKDYDFYTLKKREK